MSAPGSSMVVGVCRIRLLLHGCSSLKDKRQALSSVLAKLRSRFSIAVAEVGDNDLWQSAVIGLSAIGNDRAHVNSVMDKALDFIEDMHAGELVSEEVEYINF